MSDGSFEADASGTELSPPEQQVTAIKIRGADQVLLATCKVEQFVYKPPRPLKIATDQQKCTARNQGGRAMAWIIKFTCEF